MATTEKARTATDFANTWTAPWTNVEGYSQMWRDLLGFQVRTAKTMMDQGMSLTRKTAEHYATQMQEGAKLQQDAIKYTLTMVDDFKKVMFETADKTFKSDSH